MELNRYKYLKTIRYKNISTWDVKSFFHRIFESKYPIVPLGDYIKDENKKYDISIPNKKYGILGVDNKIGIFDAYMEDGKNINQKYKKMETGWIAYNPYRVNVGSIGIKKNEHKYDYISPAYVVFSCKPQVLNEYLFLLFKTSEFNKIIRKSTTGAVRQTLSYSVLKTLQIPLPSIEIQKRLVTKYYNYISKAESLENEYQNIDKNILEYFNETIGLKRINKNIKLLNFVRYSKITNRWDAISSVNSITANVPIFPFRDFIENISTGTTPPTSQKEYFNGNIKFYTPSDITGDMYLSKSERCLTQKAIDDKKARIFNSGDILFIGIGSTVGKVGIVRDNIVSSNQQITGIKVMSNKINIEYLFYYLHYHKDISVAEQSKTTLPIINQEKIENIPIPLPSMEQQLDMVNHINEMRNAIMEFNSKAINYRIIALKNFESEIFE